MNSPRLFSSAALLAVAASLILPLAACGSSATGSSSTSPISKLPERPAASGASASAAPEAPPPASPCPSAAPAADVKPEWTLPGATGSVAVAGSTDAASPSIKVQAPFSVTQTQVHTLKPGDGPVVAETAKVSVCYMGVNGRDGSVFDSSYEQGQPVDFSLDGVVKGFQKAIAGQKVGSTVGVAMTPADGYPDGQPSAGIQKGDSLVFAIKILSAT